MPIRLLAIIVLYGMRADESESYRSLLRAARAVQETELSLTILLYDNTPGAKPPAVLPPRVEFVPAKQNRGLSDAYNQALSVALKRGDTWLMTLDQDTSLPSDTLTRLADILTKLKVRPDVAAVVPAIQAAGRTVSPNTFVLGGWAKWFPEGFSGIPDKPTYAFNSGSVLRTSALRQVGGYSPWFWLDNSDSWIFSQLALMCKRIYVAGDIVIDHDFSMMNMEKSIPAMRYEHLLLAESSFWDLRMNRFAGWERTLRLLVRLVKHKRRKDSAALQNLTRQALGRRMFWARNKRLDHWRRSVIAKLGESPLPWLDAAGQLVISVCLTGDQDAGALSNLRSQLSSQDEILIAGSPHQPAQSFSALPAVHWVHSSGGTGLKETLRGASGDVLLLGYDGDAELLRQVRETFLMHTKLNFLHRKGGAALAFRAALLPFVLPLADTLPMPLIAHRLATERNFLAYSGEGI